MDSNVIGGAMYFIMYIIKYFTSDNTDISIMADIKETNEFIATKSSNDVVLSCYSGEFLGEFF